MVQVRHRKHVPTGNGDADSSDEKNDEKKPPMSFAQKVFFGAFALCIFVIAVLEMIKLMPIWMVNWPSSLPKLVTTEMMEDPQLLWGTYRPHVYFGVKARVPRSPVFGLAWFNQYSTSFPPSLRHWCSQDDKLRRYGWTMHDGRDFATQEIIDDNIALNTSFVKTCQSDASFCDWSARITANPINTPTHVPALFSLIFYAALDPANYDASFDPLTEIGNKNELTTLIANNVAGLGSFKLSFQPSTVISKQFAVGGVNSFEFISDYILSTLNPKPLNIHGHPRHFVVETVPPRDGARPNLILYQLTFDGPVMLDVSFFNESMPRIDDADGSELTKAIVSRSVEFRNRFDKTFDFGTGKHKFSESHKYTAMAAFSNLIGGIGYFYGHSIVLHANSKGDPVPYGPSGLYTAVPSRSFFPRGFLWDEGFHTYLLSYWDVDIVIQILSHWLDLLNRDGWIPREQILDTEARKRVPAEFIVQKSNNANPPAMFITLRRLLSLADRNTKEGQRVITFFERAYPRLSLWVDWYLTTQTGSKPGTYRWRGRDADQVYQLNSKTLTSGLDDYPRATHPTDDEYHVDLRCWIAFVTRCMAEIGKLVSIDASKYAKLADRLYDNKLLNEAHWFEDLERYADVGLHSTAVKLQRQNIEKRLPDGRIQIDQEVRRIVKKDPKFGPVSDAEGYVSLFPLMMRILEPNSDQLGILLKNLNNTSRMWTSFGLRSLSSSSAYYRKRNTEHDPPYWRGQIWVNINYLVLSSLKYYASLGEGACKHAPVAGELYEKLRHNVIGNILKQYQRTGYIWEQYDDTDGHGMGSHPFTGWSSLFVLMMAEKV